MKPKKPEVISDITTDWLVILPFGPILSIMLLQDKPKDGVKDDAWSKYMQEVKKMSGNVCERGGGGNSSLAQ